MPSNPTPTLGQRLEEMAKLGVPPESLSHERKRTMMAEMMARAGQSARLQIGEQVYEGIVARALEDYFIFWSPKKEVFSLIRYSSVDAWTCYGFPDSRYQKIAEATDAE